MKLSQSILNSLPIQIAILDSDSMIQITNTAWNSQPATHGVVKLLRAGIGVNYLDTLRKVTGRLEEDAQAIAVGVEAVLNRWQGEFTYEYAMPAGRRDRWYLVSVTPVADVEGAGVVVTYTDITSRKRAERALLESQEQFKRIAETAPVMIYRWSFEGSYEYVSPACVDVSGYQPNEFYTSPDLGHRLMLPEDVPVYEETITKIQAAKQGVFSCVVRWRHKVGHTVYVDLRLTPVVDNEGTVIAVEGIASDITQHMIARERLRELTSRVTRAHEEERERIARELHDEIGQVLTITRMRLTMVENALPDDAGDAREKLSTLNDLVNETLHSVRSLSHELRPPLLNEVGWEPALSWLCDSISQRTDMPITYQSFGNTHRLDPLVELTAYRVVQEALTNVVRHAQAGTISVSVHLDDVGLHITITDDGIGFDPHQFNRAENPDQALGLLGMEERVLVVGGSFEITSASGQGTTVRVLLPDKG